MLLVLRLAVLQSMPGQPLEKLGSNTSSRRRPASVCFVLSHMSLKADPQRQCSHPPEVYQHQETCICCLPTAARLHAGA
jgi:hypothetical protein